MLKIQFLKVFFLFCALCMEIRASTHWVVTENGRIQSQLDSPFHLRRPYDLIALLDQETRRTNITILYNEMLNRKNMIDKKWSGILTASEVEALIYSQDTNCLQAGKRLTEFDLYDSIATNGSDRIEIPLGNVGEILHIPDCSVYSELPYSMCAFEHLDAMFKKSSLTIPQEVNLNKLLPVESVDAFGNGVALELQENSTSWVHYNLAMIYWRIKGNASSAIECGRRALHVVPRLYRDIPLLTLGDVIHQSQHPKDAAILFRAALDHSPDSYLSYVALGNTYAVQYDYNQSIKYYDIALEKNPHLKTITAIRYAVLCHKTLNEALANLQNTLQAILTELHDYHSLQQQWLRLQERLLWEQTPVEAQLSAFTTEKHSVGQRCSQRISHDNSQPTITCEFTDHDAAAKFEADVSLNFQKLLDNVETETKKISEQIARSKNQRAPVKAWNGGKKVKKTKKSSNVINVEVLTPKYPLTLSPSRNLYFDLSGWPSLDECTEWNLPIQDHDDLDLPVYMPPENKGYQVSKMLTDDIGLPPEKEHELPWFPPTCTARSEDVYEIYLTPKLRQLPNINLKNTHLLKEHFLNYVQNTKLEEAEIGQRLVTAMKNKTGPPWVLAIVTSLYWRLRSNIRNALVCLDSVLTTTPQQCKDVVLLSIASILYQLGLINDAAKYAKFAFKFNFFEPSTNFLLALIHYQSNNPILATYYMKNVVRIEPLYYDGKADELLRTWACRIKMGTYEDLRSRLDKEDKELSDCTDAGDYCDSPCYHLEKLALEQGEQCSDKPVNIYRGSITNLFDEFLSRPSIDPFSLEMEDLSRDVRMKVTLRNGAATVGDFYISVAVSSDLIPEPIINVQDTSGTYGVSTRICLEMREIDWYSFRIKWQSSASRNVNIKHLLKPLSPNTERNLRPECNEPPPGILILDRLTKVFVTEIPDIQEEALTKWFGKITGDETSSVADLGAKIYAASQEHSTSWVLATAASLYWRIIGDASKAVTCLKQALVHVPGDMKDIPLISMAYIYERAALYNEALEIASLAVESNPNYVVNHFTIGNIHDAMGDLGKALSFYRSSLALDSNFEPAQIRIKDLLCSFLFYENGTMKDVTTNVE